MRNFRVKINLQKLVFVIIFFSSIFFNGGISIYIDFDSLNNYSDLLFGVFFLIAPIISFEILSYYFKNRHISINIRPFSVPIGLFVFLFILINNFKHQNLNSDEFYYTYGCFKIVNGIFDAFQLLEISLLYNFSYGMILRLGLLVLLLGSFFLIRYMFSHHDFMISNKLYSVILLLLKFLVLKIVPYSDAHAPMNYFSASIFISLFGLNPISMKSSIIFFNTLFIVYLYNRLHLSKASIIFISMFIFSTPVISDSSTRIMQANYSMLCYSIVIIEIFFRKIKPEYLMLFISIFCLFRYSSLAAFPSALIYSYIYHNSKNNNILDKIIKTLQSMVPIVLTIPILFFPILYGTPSTKGVEELNFFNLDYFNSSYLLSSISIDAFGFLLFIPLLTFIFLMFSNKKHIIGYIILLYFSFHILSVMADLQFNKFHWYSKYLMEQIGFVFIFSFVYITLRLNNSNHISKRLKIPILSFLIISALLFNNHKSNVKNDYYKTISDHYQNNNRDYIMDYISTKDLFDQSIIIGKDYSPMLLGLYNATVFNLKEYLKNYNQFTKMNKKNNVEWLTIDPSVINQMENITHIFIADGLYKYNEKNISELLTSYGWEITQKLDKTNFFSGFYVLKNLRLN